MRTPTAAAIPTLTTRRGPAPGAAGAIRTRSTIAATLGALLAVCGAAPGQEKTPTPGTGPSLESLIQSLEAREGKVESVRMTMKTSGRWPDGVTFTTSGTLALLGQDRFHVSMVLRASEDDLYAEVETLKTEAGVWMREKDPHQGEVVTFMDPKLASDLESAQDFLDAAAAGDGHSGGILGTSGPAGGNQVDAPLGSAMLRDLDRAFALKVASPRVLDGVEVFVVDGPVRAAPAELEADTPDFVEVLVRKADLAVVRMRQLRGGEKVLEVRIEQLELDVPLPEGTFDPAQTVLAEGRDALLLDVREHPPARQQIDQLFAEARAVGWKRPSQRPDRSGETPPGGGDAPKESEGGGGEDR